jgi:hypothetical protein
VPANKNIDKSLMCLIGFDGVIAYTYNVGCFYSNNFWVFINNKLVPYFLKNLCKVLIMDNAQFYKSEVVLQALKQNNIPFKFLVTYSPELNPIEEFFQCLNRDLCD